MDSDGEFPVFFQIPPSSPVSPASSARIIRPQHPSTTSARLFSSRSKHIPFFSLPLRPLLLQLTDPTRWSQCSLFYHPAPSSIPKPPSPSTAKHAPTIVPHAQIHLNPPLIPGITPLPLPYILHARSIPFRLVRPLHSFIRPITLSPILSSPPQPPSRKAQRPSLSNFIHPPQAPPPRSLPPADRPSPNHPAFPPPHLPCRSSAISPLSP